MSRSDFKAIGLTLVSGTIGWFLSGSALFEIGVFVLGLALIAAGHLPDKRPSAVVDVRGNPFTREPRRWMLKSMCVFAVFVVIAGAVWKWKLRTIGNPNLQSVSRPRENIRNPAVGGKAKEETRTASPTVSNPHPSTSSKHKQLRQPQHAPSVSAPNGIAIGGNNSGSASVTNYNGIYPPPNVVPTITVCLSRDPGKITLVMTTDTAISEPGWWFKFDGPVTDVTASAEPKPSATTSGHADQKQRPDDWQNIVGVTINSIGGIPSSAPWRPGQPVTVTVNSEHPVDLLEIIYGMSLGQRLMENFVYHCN